jgi:hypothetical protein
MVLLKFMQGEWFLSQFGTGSSPASRYGDIRLHLYKDNEFDGSIGFWATAKVRL